MFLNTWSLLQIGFDQPTKCFIKNIIEEFDCIYYECVTEDNETYFFSSASIEWIKILKKLHPEKLAELV